MLSVKTLVRILINTLIGLVLIFTWVRFVNLEEVFKTISKVSLIGLMPVFSFMFVSPLIRTVRLKLFLSEVKKVSLREIFFLNGTALILNFFIPIRVGEVIKGVYLNTHYGIPLGKAVIWVFLDRFVDFLAVLALACLLLLVVPSFLSITIIMIIIVILVITLILTYLAVFQKDFAKKLVQFLKPLLIFSHIKIYFESFSYFILEAFSILKRHPKDLLFLVILTVFAYLADASIWYFTFISLGSHQDFLKMYLGQLLSALTYLIPAAPGYVGSAEASGLLILSGIFGIEKNLASAMTVLFHMASAVFVIIFGLISIFSLKLDLGAVFKKALNRS